MTVRNNEAFAALEPYNGRALDLEIDFDSKAIGRQVFKSDLTAEVFTRDLRLLHDIRWHRDRTLVGYCQEHAWSDEHDRPWDLNCRRCLVTFGLEGQR